MIDYIKERQIADFTLALQELGCVVVVFTEEELRGANPDSVEDRLIELGWEIINSFADDQIEQDWNQAIK